MSNDIKYWLWRIGLAGLMVVDSGILSMMVSASLQKHGNVKPWAVLFFVAIIVTVAVGFGYVRAKQKRWDSSVDSYSELETLNAYMREQQRQKQAQQGEPSDTGRDTKGL